MAECLQPFQRKDQVGKSEACPCGKCVNCLKRRVSGWSFRLMQEYKRSTSGHFITLTYDTDNVPLTGRGFMSLSKRDVQLFFKRLRKAHTSEMELPIKYYAAGEYGGRTSRPHYHIILFNAKLELIQPAWNLGQLHYGTLTEASVGYTLKYIHKKPFTKKHANDDRQPEFALMSKGLGANYLTKAMVQWHKNHMEDRQYLTIADGKKIAMPRYYKLKIYDDDERSIIADAAKVKAEKQFLQKFKKYGDKLPLMVENNRLAENAKAKFKNISSDKL